MDSAEAAVGHDHHEIARPRLSRERANNVVHSGQVSRGNALAAQVGDQLIFGETLLRR